MIPPLTVTATETVNFLLLRMCQLQENFNPVFINLQGLCTVTLPTSLTHTFLGDDLLTLRGGLGLFGVTSLSKDI